MTNPTELERVGRAAVVNHLQYEGWTITESNPGGAGYLSIIASKDNVVIVVRVKTALSPQRPGLLSEDEDQEIRSRAVQIQATPYVALVQLEQSNAPSIRYLVIK